MSKLEPARTYSNHTATEILRRLLDERGVEWWQKKRHTCWKVGKGQEVEMWRAWEAPDGSLTLKVDYIYDLTPEQVIAATLGMGTCKRVFYEPTGVYVCSECGRGLSKKLDKYCYLHFCPNCGRKVVDA